MSEQQFPFWEIDWLKEPTTGYDTEEEALEAIANRYQDYKLEDAGDGWEGARRVVAGGEEVAVLWEVGANMAL